MVSKNIMFAGCSERYSREVKLTCGVRISSGVIYKVVLDSAIMFWELPPDLVSLAWQLGPFSTCWVVATVFQRKAL